jgi:hypothetical protein
MNTADVEEALQRRGYVVAPVAEAKVEAMPEAPGVYVLLADGAGGLRTLGVWAVRDPWLRTDAAANLAKPEIAQARPALVAYRALEQAAEEGVLRHHAGIVAEQAETIAALRRLR